MLKVGDVIRIKRNKLHRCFNGAIGIIEEVALGRGFNRGLCTVYKIRIKSLSDDWKPEFQFAIDDWYTFCDYETELVNMENYENLKKYINTLVENVKP